MKKRLTKMIAWLLVSVLAFAMMTMNAGATTEAEGGQVSESRNSEGEDIEGSVETEESVSLKITDTVFGTWYPESKTLSITGTGDSRDYYYTGLLLEPVEPGEEGYEEYIEWLENYKGGHITPWMDYNDEIETICVQEGITRIGAYSFDECKALKRIEIAESVTSIGTGALPVYEDNSQLTICGYGMSAAELYAAAYGYNFEFGNEQLLGDVNCNAAYDVMDALAILQMCVGLNEMYPYTADANQDGTVNAGDALYVLQKYVRM